MILTSRMANDGTNLAFGTRRSDLRDLIANHMAVRYPWPAYQITKYVNRLSARRSGRPDKAEHEQYVAKSCNGGGLNPLKARADIVCMPIDDLPLSFID